MCACAMAFEVSSSYPLPYAPLVCGVVSLSPITKSRMKVYKDGSTHLLLCSNQAHVDSPNHTCKCTNKISPLHCLDHAEVDDANRGPQLTAGDKDGPKLVQRQIPDVAPVDTGKVDGSGLRPVGDGLGERGDAGGGHGGEAEGVDEVAEEEGVESGADGLVEGEFDQGVADGELWRCSALF